MGALADWWAVESDASLSQAEKLSLSNSIRYQAFMSVPLPFIVDLLTVTSVDVVGGRVDVNGIGLFSWPLRIYNGPVGVSDPDGNVVRSDGSRWLDDPMEVIAQGIRSVP